MSSSLTLNLPETPEIGAPGMLTYATPEDGPFRRALINSVEVLGGRNRLEPLYQKVMQQPLLGREVWQAAVDVLDLQVVWEESQIAKIPEDGPLVFVANHPFGVVDGLILGALAAKVRRNFHFLVHEALIHHDPRLDQFLLPVDFRETRSAMQTNLATRRASIERLGKGEALVIFPGGGVATRKKGFGELEEYEWKRFVASVVHKSKATVVPVFFHGENSRLFHLISQLSMTVRLGMMLHEIRNKIGKSFRVEIGNPLPFSELSHLKGRQQLLDHLCSATMSLGRR